MQVFRILPFAAIFIITHDLVNGSNFWKIGNEVPEELRPYTKTAMDPSTTGPTYTTTHDKVLAPKFREMHRYCDGQCFYAPESCALSNEFVDCDIAASVAMHNEDKDGLLYCDYFGPDNLRQSFCSKSEEQQKYYNKTKKRDIFYTVTLHFGLSKFTSKSCENKWNEKTGRRCRRTEFVGISFLNDQAANQDDYDEDDLWYICIVDESHLTRISMWTKLNQARTSAQQIMGTQPHLESGMGVVFSKVRIDEDTVSMGCQFVLQESKMTLTDPPKNAAFFMDKSKPIRVKLGGGTVDRDVVDDSIIHPFKDAPTTRVYKGAQIKPTDQIFFNALKVTITDPNFKAAAEERIEENNAKALKEIINKCDKPGNYPDMYIACYPPNEQKNCVHTGRCPVMFIVEIPRSDTSFNKIRAHLYSLLPDSKSLRKVTRPMGFASVGFSFDNKMGRDVVITCHANGRQNISLYVSINYEKANIFPGKVDYTTYTGSNSEGLIQNPKTFGTVVKSKILCSWEMNTKFVVNMFDYEPDYRSIIYPGQSEKLVYDFKKEPVFLLVAAGNRNYPYGKIVYHDFRQVLEGQFSREEFFKVAKGSRLVASFGMICLFAAFAIMVAFF